MYDKLKKLFWFSFLKFYLIYKVLLLLLINFLQKNLLVYHQDFAKFRSFLSGHQRNIYAIFYYHPFDKLIKIHLLNF